MTDLEYDICETQGEIFQIAAGQGYDMEVFAKEYLTSDFCRRQFDSPYSRYQCADGEESWDVFFPDLKNKFKKYPDGKFFRCDVANWIGFTYRQVCFLSGLSSASVLRSFSPAIMAKLYPGYHTLGYEMAGERLLETLNEQVKPSF